MSKSWLITEISNEIMYIEIQYVRSRGKGSGRGHGARARRRGGRAKRRSRRVIKKKSSSEEELQLSDSSSDKQLLCAVIRHKPKYRVGVRVRKKFDDKFYNGTITRVNRSDGQCHVKYCDGDSESMSEGEIKQHIMTM